MVVVEAFLSALFEILLNKLVADPVLEYARRLKVDMAVLQKWRSTLPHLRAVLHHAEQRQIREEEVRTWLDNLKALAFDMEDLLHEFEAEAKRPSLVQGPQTSSSSSGGKVRKLIPSFHSSGAKKKIGQKIESITKDLETIVEGMSLHRLSESVGGVASVTDQRQPTAFLVDKAEVYGRDGDKEKIIELLLSDDTADKVQVIPIVGMGGVGKTTLAQIIYNDARMQDKFDFRVWVCVSDQFDLIRITKEILESVSSHSSHPENFSLLQDSLQKKLNGKRFFLVLDDIWIENPNNWSTLQAPLKAGAQGSVIIVTTRNEQVASIMRTASSYPLSELSDEHCWSLFSHRAFENITPDAIKNLEPIGRKIIQKCKGLPLAAKTLGGLLRSEQEENAWKNMLNNEIWDLSPKQSDILPALHLSYHYLSTKLKQCFAYCSVFPKDYKYRKEELILLWVAQGFVGDFKGEEMIEDGEICFRNLLSRSFFQQSSQNKSLFVMHDLIHDLAQFVSGEFCFRLEVGKQKNFSRRARHLSYIREQFDVSKKFDPLHEVDKLRTFLPLGWGGGYLADKVLRDLLPKFRCLRVLSLSGYNITHLPADLFQNLKHLRYLNLSSTNIQKLPKSIGMLCNLQLLNLSSTNIQKLPKSIGMLCNLQSLNLSSTKIQKLPKSIGMLCNLQSLMLSYCHRITELPPEIENLIHLHHLDISGTNLEGMPTGINKLKDLRRLTTFVVGKHSGARITELQDLSHLRGALSILNLQNVVNAMDALKANLKKKEDLDDLVFAWDPNVSDNVSENQTRVLENLQPHTKVKRLGIHHYYGTKFPKWLGHPSFMNLVFLRLGDCKNFLSLPPLGQLQSLKYLWIVKMDGVQNVGADFYGNNDCDSSSIKPFGSLETLRFEKMLEWEEWVCRGVEFPCLKELHINECPKLKKDLPEHLPKLTKLEISECKQLVCCLPMAPSIRELMLEECDDVVVRSASSLTSLASLDIFNVCKIPDELGQLNSLVRLSVIDCPELKEIPPILHSLTSLKNLNIQSCESLASFPEMALPPMLESLEISGTTLESLPEGMMQNNTTLQHLVIGDCDSLRSLPRDIDSLKRLSIYGCKKLELALHEDMTHNHYASLTEFEISYCDSFTSFPLASFTKLENLDIENCGNLESLYIPDGLHHVDLTSLQKLRIDNCPNLVSFPQGGLPTPNLTFLRISDCKKLKSLPQGMHSLLTSLEDLIIEDCPEIDSFPIGGLPTNLSDLEIRNCNKLMACRMEWRLQTLPFLRTLEIEGLEEERLESFPEEWFLPSTLTSLSIKNFPNLKSLDNKGLEHLTSLETLWIMECEKLESLPKQGLPSSLSRLYIRKCPLLEKRCQRDKGKKWSNISHIPCIQIFNEKDFSNEVILS